MRRTHLLGKLLATALALVLMAAMAVAQTPQKMSYQAVVRDAGGQLVTNRTVGVRISIVSGEATGAVVYQEIFNPPPPPTPTDSSRWR